jgi:hypothetical protein
MAHIDARPGQPANESDPALMSTAENAVRWGGALMAAGLLVSLIGFVIWNPRCRQPRHRPGAGCRHAGGALRQGSGGFRVDRLDQHPGGHRTRGWRAAARGSTRPRPLAVSGFGVLAPRCGTGDSVRCARRALRDRLYRDRGSAGPGAWTLRSHRSRRQRAVHGQHRDHLDWARRHLLGGITVDNRRYAPVAGICWFRRLRLQLHRRRRSYPASRRPDRVPSPLRGRLHGGYLPRPSDRMPQRQIPSEPHLALKRSDLPPGPPSRPRRTPREQLDCSLHAFTQGVALLEFKLLGYPRIQVRCSYSWRMAERLRTNVSSSYSPSSNRRRARSS